MQYFYDEKTQGILCAPNSAEEWLELIQDVAFDQDGFSKAEDLKELNREICGMAKLAQECLMQGNYFKNDITEYKSLLAAQKKEKEIQNGGNEKN